MITQNGEASKTRLKESDFSSITKAKAEVGYDSSLSQPQERSDGFIREDSDTERNRRLLRVTVL